MRKYKTLGDRVFDVANLIFMFIIMLAMLYPITYVIFASISDPMKVRSMGGVLLWPVNFTLQGYSIIFQNDSVLIGYRNTLLYVVLGTAINLLMTSLGAYVLSRRGPMLNKVFMVMIIVTMYFSGGMIPTYFVVKDMGMINTIWSMVIPNALATYNLILMRTAFMAMPEELEQSARIDGANDIVILFRIVLPLSTAILAVMGLYYGVGHWNSWFNAVLYLRKRELFPLQIFLREILILNNTMTDPNTMVTRDALENMITKMLVKYTVTVVATLPILIVYPFLQKYFVKGVMIGSLKG